jgi:hypothetical protein
VRQRRKSGLLLDQKVEHPAQLPAHPVHRLAEVRQLTVARSPGRRWKLLLLLVQQLDDSPQLAAHAVDRVIECLEPLAVESGDRG